MSRKFFDIKKGGSFYPQAAAPSDPENGDFYYDSVLLCFRGYVNGAWVNFGSGGGASVTYQGTAGQNLATNDAVYICATSLDGGRDVGSIYKVDPSSLKRVVYLGIVTAGVSAGATVTVQVAGEMSGFTGLKEGMAVYASITTPGATQLTAPVSPYVTVLLGWGSTVPTKMIINGALGGLDSAYVIVDPAGYAAGGYNGSATQDVQKMLFATEVVSTISAVLANANYYFTGTSSSLKGYIGGGAAPLTDSFMTFVFSSQTSATLAAVLVTPKETVGGGQSGTKGYYSQGVNSGSTFYNTVDALTFITEMIAAVGNAASSAQGPIGVSSSTSVYYCGGYNGSYLTSISKLSFSTETSAANANSLSTARSEAMGVFNADFGYIGGGTNGGFFSSIERVDYSNDAVSTLAASLGTARANGCGVSSAIKGYFQGGNTSGGGSATAANEFVLYSNETTGTAANALNFAVRAYPAGFQV